MLFLLIYVSRSFSTEEQRARKIISKRRNDVLQGIWGKELTEEEWLVKAFPETSSVAQAQKATVTLVKNSRFTKQNPTLREIADNVLTTMSKDEPIRIVLSQCFLRPKLFIENACWVGIGAKERISSDRDAALLGVRALGWSLLRKSAQELQYPVVLEIILGDQDLLSTFRCNQWCSEEKLMQLKKDAERIKLLTENAAQKYFAGIPNLSVVVRLWSELYTYTEFEERLVKVCAWAETAAECKNLFARACKVYFGSWGLQKFGVQYGVTIPQLESFVRDDLLRTIAQYSLEGDVVKERNAIQAWGEKNPDWLMPYETTNVLCSKKIPTLFLCKSEDKEDVTVC